MKKFDKYYNLKVGDEHYKGRRNPLRRLKKIPLNFKNKTVLDLGCNIGGMLFPIQDKIKWGYGYDYDSDAINLANELKEKNKFNNLEFFICDFEKDKLDFPETDIVFMLSIANWVKNWKELIEITKPNILVFEAHGNDKKKKQQFEFLKEKYKKVKLLLAEGEGLRGGIRELYLCKKFKMG